MKAQKIFWNYDSICSKMYLKYERNVRTWPQDVTCRTRCTLRVWLSHNLCNIGNLHTNHLIVRNYHFSVAPGKPLQIIILWMSSSDPHEGYYHLLERETVKQAQLNPVWWVFSGKILFYWHWSVESKISLCKMYLFGLRFTRS
jgi:hypothetical protein